MFLSTKSYLRVRIALAGVMAVIFALAPFFSIQNAKAAIPQTINYQSRLLTPGGLPVTSTTAIQLSFYFHPTNGASGDVPAQAGPLVWKEIYDQGSGACSMITPDAKGYFFLKLGSCAPFPSYLDFSEVMYVGVKIGVDAEASPRVQLSSHPYALNAYRLNGFEATSTATANQLLALDSNLNFNIATGTFTGAGLFINGTSTLQEVTFTVATGTSLNLTQYLAIGAIRLDSVGTNNQTSGAYLVGVFDEFVNSNATTVQAALFDLDTAITTVSSTLYAMDLQLVTDNGNITTNWIEFAGGTTTGDILPANDIAQNLGALNKRWSEVYTDWLSVGDWNWWLGQATGQNFGIYGTAEHFTIATNGNVGINNVNPEENLSIYGNALIGQDDELMAPLNGQDRSLIIRSRDGFFAGVQGESMVVLQRDSANIARMGLDTLDNIVFDHWDGASWVSGMLVSSLGNVGIGLTNPLYNLDIANDLRLAGQFMLGQFGVLPAIGEQDGALVYSTASSTPYFWDGTQWVAFATGTNPGALNLQQVTDNGNLTTNWIEFAGGTSTGSINPDVDGAYTLGVFDRQWGEIYTHWLTVGGNDYWWMGEDANQSFSIYGSSQHFVIATSGNVGINTDTPIYQFDVNGITRSRGQLIMGRSMLLPITGAEVGAMLWQGFDNRPYYWNGSQWLRFASYNDLNDYWSLSGNFASNPLTDYLGTADNQPLVFRTNAIERMRLLTDGSLGIGTNAPTSLLHVQGGSNGSALLLLDSDDGNANGRDAGIIINSDNNNGSDAAYLIFKNNGLQSAKFLGGTSGSGFDLAASTTFGINQAGFVRLHMTDMGNFGFATDTPAYRVDVLGDARLSAQLMLGQYAVNPVSGHQAGAIIYNTADLVPYYWDGSSWIAFATGTAAEMDTLQTVTDRGASTTNPIVFAGGTSTASLEVTGELSINGIRLSASGTNPLVSGAYLVGTFDEFANFNATTVQAALKAIDSMLTFGSASTSVFVGLTAGSYDGAFSYGGKVGYQAANDICINEYPGSHFCRTDEIIATIAMVDISTLFMATTFGWIAEGPPGYTANSNDCAGYTTNSNTSLGAFWAYDPNGGGMGWLNNCQVTRKISCCR